MLWICLTAWAGLFIWYFRMRKKAEDHKLVRRIFCLADRVYSGHCTLPSDRSAKSFRR